MSQIITILTLLAVIFGTFVIFYMYRAERQKLAEKMAEYKRIKEMLDDEVTNGHNLARITALRLRMRKLEHDLDRW